MAEAVADSAPLPPTAPWWAQLAVRFGVTAVLACGLLYYVGDLLRSFPASLERQADKITAAITSSGEAQIRAMEASERRAEDRTRMAVERLMAEIQKNK